LVEVFGGSDEKRGWGVRVTNESELMAAIERTITEPDKLALIEVMFDPNDCTPELLEFGKRVSSANQRPFIPDTVRF
jgi:pyruvate decarboxylase